MKTIGKIPKKIEYIYISGPLTTGSLTVNIREMCKVADKLMAAGFVPFNPASSFLQDVVAYKSYQSWISYDYKMVEKMGFVLRIPGKSKGGDLEIVYAKKHKIPCIILEKREEIEHFIGQFSLATRDNI